MQHLLMSFINRYVSKGPVMFLHPESKGAVFFSYMNYDAVSFFICDKTEGRTLNTIGGRYGCTLKHINLP